MTNTWKSRVEDHPLSFAATLLTIGFGFGVGFMTLLESHKHDAPAHLPAAASPEAAHSQPTLTPTSTPTPTMMPRLTPRPTTGTVTGSSSSVGDGDACVKLLAARRAMDDRFTERGEFERRQIGQRMTCALTVDDVDESGSVPTLYLREGRREMEFARFVCAFPASFKTRVFGLRRGDRVKVVGAVSSLSVARLALNCEDFQIADRP